MGEEGGIATGSDGPHPATSIIIRAKNEEAMLGETLRRLHTQTFRDFEIILVDSGSTDRTIEIARGFASVRVVQMPASDFTFGRALNLGCRHSRGDIMVFLSAHALPGTDRWLAKLLAPFEDHQVAGVWGAQARRPGAEPAPRLVRQDLSGFHRNIYFGFNNSNGAARKAIWERFPFHEGMPGSEDKEWAMRVLALGYTLVHDSEAFVYHRHEDSIRQAWWRSHREHLGYVQFLPEHRVGILENMRYAYYAIRGAWEPIRTPGRITRFARRVPRILATTAGRYTGSHRRTARVFA